MPAVTLPHPLRPAVPSPVDAPAMIDPQLGIAVLVLIAVAALGWWWLRRQRPVRLRHSGPDVPSSWGELETAVGAPDWYERFGRRLCAVNGYGVLDHHRTSRLLTDLAAGEAGRPWQQTARRWEWAIYAGHAGSAAEHQADLQLARARWP